MTTKQRAYLKSLAMTMEPIFQVGKSSMTPGLTQAISEALEARELIKISVLKNCADDPRELAEIISERTRSEIVQVIGKKIVLYREGSSVESPAGCTRRTMSSAVFAAAASASAVSIPASRFCFSALLYAPSHPPATRILSTHSSPSIPTELNLSMALPAVLLP